LVGHVLVVVLVVAFVNFGFWQLRRLEERRNANAVIQARSSVPVQPLPEVVDPDATFVDVEGLPYRRVVVRGTYDADASVLVRSRALEGRPGFHVLTPLVLDGGSAVMVNRGFAPFTAEPAEALAATRPPAGEVEVAGLLLGTQERQGIGPTDPAEGVLTQIARVDLARLQQQSSADLYPVYLQLKEQSLPSGELPVALPAPEQTEGNHLTYAVQWFLFAAVGAMGWPVLLRHTAREDGDRASSLSTPSSPSFFVDSAVSETADPTKKNGDGVQRAPASWS
jgi:cytochrome oxidase assembly protein ShyY1